MSGKYPRGQKGLGYLDINCSYPEARYMPAAHVSQQDAHNFSKPWQPKKWTFGGSISLLFLALHRMFAVNVPDFKVSINLFMFRMHKARCLNVENQTVLCQNLLNLCNLLYFLFVQMPILHAYICNTNATWVCSYENVALCRNLYAIIHTIFRKKKSNGDHLFQVQTALKTRKAVVI